MKILSLEEATTILAEAEQRNPGAWVNHSLFTAKAAEAIALGYPGLHSETAFILGLLHDIGRRAGVSDMRHVLDGYHFLAQLGYEDAARISMTHSFPVKNAQAMVGQWDCTSSELEFIQSYLNGIEYDEYDRLIQLCDSLALPSGFCLIEKRLVDVALRHGLNEYTLPRWKAYLNIQIEFEQVLNKSIYDCLPGVVENTFRINLLSIGN